MVLAENFGMAFNEPLRMAREHQVFAAGQRAADAFKGLPPHHDNVAHRDLFEPFEIVRQVPGDFSCIPNHTVLRHRSDGFKMFQGQFQRLWLELATSGAGLQLISHRYWSLNGRVRVVADQLKIFKLKVMDVAHCGIQFHFWQRTRFARELQFGLFDMVRVEV